MYHSNRELWLSFSAIMIITLIYLFIVITLKNIPAASGLFGHSIGILGFIMMLMTETIYSIRKRSRNARWGRMSSWLQFHIFTGLVGPYLVLLHSSWKFNGFAGVVTLLTVIIVVSGFIGRYIYTSIPRSVDGIELDAGDLAFQISIIEAELQIHNPLSQKNKKQNRLEKQRRHMQRQVASLSNARQMLALWHMIHIPIGLTLFTAALIHIAAAIYYAVQLW